MALFQNSVVNKYLKQQDSDVVAKAYKKFTKYFHNPTIQQNIRERKEEQFQEGFLIELFVNVLDYTLAPNPKFNLTTELKNEKGAKKADGAILSRGHDPLAKPTALGVIELKSTKTQDLEKVRQQAFDYKANQTGCVYVITSNFEKVRFYINNAVEFEEFDLFTINQERFELLYLCLAKDNLLGNVPLKIKEASIQEEEKITKKFYADYSLFKRELFRDLVKLNMKNEVFRSELNNEDTERANKNIKHHLFKKSQKLIDRFLFIFFAEDRGLLPPNSTMQILDQWNRLKDDDAYFPLYHRYKLYFNYLDQGRVGKNGKAEIFAYNGGLFKPDPVLDSLMVGDDLLFKHTKALQAYDFESQVDVNILGHIFENSLNEIESVNAEIEGTDFDKQKTKRKKDGVFYTPKYITKYIVDNTVGKLCNEKKEKLKIVEEEYHPSHQKKTKKKLLAALETYREWLLQLTILDPACGSGAFLNQALDFLIKEHGYIDELQTNLLGGGLVFPNIENTVLENNIFGVDINEESVDIARLSLWLRTAQPRRKLNDLSSNIKCGNSLIDSKAVAGDKAFKWEEEFPHIFKGKEKEAFHITTATHDSRTSQRMVDYKVRELRDNGTRPKAEGIWLAPEDEVFITKTVAEIVEEDRLNVMAFNICGDHMHILLVCEDEEVSKIVGKIKAITSKEYNTEKGITTRGHVPLSKEEKKTYNSLWTQKFGNNPIKDEKQLWNTVEYIQNNREKHALNPLPTIEGTSPLVLIKEMCCSYEHAFRAEATGGFDVVIGNPPYVRAELLGEFQEYLKQNYSLHNPSGDLFSYFYEKSFKLLKANTGLFCFISNTFDKTTAGISLREYLQTEISFLKYIDFTEVQIFEGATTYPVIITAQNIRNTKNSFQFIKIPKKSQSLVIDIDLHHFVSVEQLSLEKSNWSFKSKSAVNFISKLKENKTVREIYGKCYYGVKTALNEAFIIPKTYEVGAHVKPIFEGKELSKWVSSESVQQLILFQSKWTKKEYGNDTTEKTGIQKLTNDYPELLSHILPLEERAKKRHDKGDFFWELRNCAYYDLFEKPKVVFPNLQNRNKFSFDETGSYINAPAVILPTNDKSLTAILNSKLVWYFLTNICVVRSGGYIEVKPQYFEQIPIPTINNKEDLEAKTNAIIDFTSKMQKVANKFTNYLQSKFKIEKLPKKLQNWHELEFGEFITELNKAIVKGNKEVATATTRGHVPLAKLTKMDEMEWMDAFETKKAEAQTLKAKIDRIDKEIDAMVYDLYSLTEEEIQIVEQS